MLNPLTLHLPPGCIEERGDGGAGDDDNDDDVVLYHTARSPKRLGSLGGMSLRALQSSFSRVGQGEDDEDDEEDGELVAAAQAMEGGGVGGVGEGGGDSSGGAGVMLAGKWPALHDVEAEVEGSEVRVCGWLVD